MKFDIDMSVHAPGWIYITCIVVGVVLVLVFGRFSLYDEPEWLVRLSGFLVNTGAVLMGTAFLVALLQVVTGG